MIRILFIAAVFLSSFSSCQKKKKLIHLHCQTVENGIVVKEWDSFVTKDEYESGFFGEAPFDAHPDSVVSITGGLPPNTSCFRVK